MMSTQREAPFGADQDKGTDAQMAADVQRALTEAPAPSTANLNVEVTAGTAVLRGTVADTATRQVASERTRTVPGVQSVVNLVGVEAATAQQAREPVSAIGYGYPWLHDLIERGTGLDLDLEQVTAVAQLAERKLADLFDVATDTAVANGRMRVYWHDLPVTKGLRRLLREVATLATEVEREPVFVFLADVGVSGPFDELVRAETPKLMAALLLLSGRVMSALEPASIPPIERMELLTRRDRAHPTPWEIERAAQVLDLTL